MKSSIGFRNSILWKVPPPENRSIYGVAKESGISPTTIHSWFAKLKDGKLYLNLEDGEPTHDQRA
ncbi:MAG: helix-turn-helix domain-containing protein, partial [Spirochaetales bacterium]|nr:helix-turn-helix domain-containing protein [Spirochaetales bacterium]